MRRRIIASVTGLAATGLITGAAFAAGGASTSSRLDDGKDLRPQATITEQQAIDAAQAKASGALNEVDLERYHGQLVYNVDVGAKDVKVDAASGKVLDASQDN
jgi:uncharacterized membrane protein YkoI